MKKPLMAVGAIAACSDIGLYQGTSAPPDATSAQGQRTPPKTLLPVEPIVFAAPQTPASHPLHSPVATSRPAADDAKTRLAPTPIDATPNRSRTLAKAAAPSAGDDVGERSHAEPETGKRRHFIKPPSGARPVLRDALASRDYLVSDLRDQLALGAEDDVQLATSKRDRTGHVYYKYRQTYGGVPVVGREIVVQTGPEDDLRAVSGEVEVGIELTTDPALEGDEALRRGFGHLAETPVRPPLIHEGPDLWVYVDESDHPPVLAYRAVVEYPTHSFGHRLEEIFVDANEGTLVARFNRIYSALEREIYDMDQRCLQSGQELPGSFSFGEDGADDLDAAEHGAYENTGTAYWFYHHFFQRDSFDDQGATLKSSVHARFSTGQGSTCNANNAFFAGSPYNQMIYGDGDGQRMWNLAGALDITGHELTHGITFSESNLQYRNESGAINEALSDIFGAAIEAWSDSGGGAAGNPEGGIQVNEDTWIAGEDAVHEDYTRYMSNPTQDGHSVDDYNEIKRADGQPDQSNDNGHVHSNSGIMNLAFHLLSEGGEHPRSVSTAQVPAVGFETALQIYYHASVNLFTSTTGFASARDLLAQSAETLYGECSEEWHAVQLSFDAVNVPGDWSSCVAGGDSDSADGSEPDGGADPDPDPDPDHEPEPEPEPNPDADADPRNIALGASVTVSSQYNAYYGGSNLNDGDAATPWVSQRIDSVYQQQWAMLDFGTSEAFQAIEIDWIGSDYARKYAAWRWDDPSAQWVYLGEGSQYAPGAGGIGFESITGRYLLVTMQNGSPGRWMAMSELLVH